MGKKSREKELYWRNLLDKHAESGLSIRQFCAGQSLSEPSFYAWRRKLNKRDLDRPDLHNSANLQSNGQRSTAGKTKHQKRQRVASTKTSDFISLRLLEEASVLEIVHPQGCRIRVNGQVNTTTLSQVLDVLDGRTDVRRIL